MLETYISKAIFSEFQSTTSKFSTITQREREILSLISHGYTTKEIAQKLFISYKTVETHRANIFSKLHVKNIAEAINIAIKYKII